MMTITPVYPRGADHSQDFALLFWEGSNVSEVGVVVHELRMEIDILDSLCKSDINQWIGWWTTSLLPTRKIGPNPRTVADTASGLKI